MTLLRTILSIETFVTGNITTQTSPTRHTLTSTSNMITFTTMLTITFKCTSWTIITSRTWMFASQTNITITTSNLSRYMITTLITMLNYWTFFLAAVTIESILTGLCTIFTGPAGRTATTSGIGITGGIIFTSANLITRLTIITRRTICFTMNAFNIFVLLFRLNRVKSIIKTINQKAQQIKKKRNEIFK